MTKSLLGTLVLGVLLNGCMSDPTLDDNRAPIASAGADQDVEWNGEAVEVTLDGRKSRDLDGAIVGYDWRLVPLAADAGADEPSDVPGLDNVVRPRITLTQGTYTFTLWVRDNEDAIGVPDTVRIRVGGDPVATCVEGTDDRLDETCRTCLCNQGAECQTAAPACGEDCWSLVSCIAVDCPTFTMDNDLNCVLESCGPFVASGQTGAMEAGACVADCADACGASFTAIGAGS